MKIPALPKSFVNFRAAGRIIACAGAVLVAAQFAHAADQVDVFLTGLKFGAGESLHATSKSRTIDAAAEYEYTLTGIIRGTSGTPLAKVIKVGTPISAFLESLSPGASDFLTGSFTNPGGVLPATVLDKRFSGTRKIKGLGDVKFSFKVVGKILADGQCVLDVKNVVIKTNPPQDLGSITFSKGSALNIKVKP